MAAGQALGAWGCLLPVGLSATRGQFTNNPGSPPPGWSSSVGPNGTDTGITPYIGGGGTGYGSRGQWQGGGPSPAQQQAESVKERNQQNKIDSLQNEINVLQEKQSELTDKSKQSERDSLSDQLKSKQKELSDAQTDLQNQQNLFAQQWAGGGPSMASSSGNSGGGLFDQLFGTMQSGLKETFLPPGFTDLTQTPMAKSAGALLSFFGGLLGGQGSSGMLGGGNLFQHPVLAALTGYTQQPGGPIQPGSPVYDSTGTHYSPAARAAAGAGLASIRPTCLVSSRGCGRVRAPPSTITGRALISTPLIRERITPTCSRCCPTTTLPRLAPPARQPHRGQVWAPVRFSMSRLLLTPDLARKWLANTGNNAGWANAAKVARFAADMRAGEWQPNSTIEVSDKGQRGICFEDGCHRALAVIHSGCSIEFDVRGLP